MTKLVPLGKVALLVCLIFPFSLVSNAQSTNQNQASQQTLAAEIAIGLVQSEVPNWARPLNGGLYEVPGFNAGNPVLYNNGPLINSTCVGTGADQSFLQAPLITYGFGFQHAIPIYVADDFTVPVGEEWTVDNMITYGYQTGSGPPSTFDGLYVRVWNGKPGVAGSAIIWGDMVTNRLIETTFSGIYRVNTDCVTNRPIMMLKADFGGEKFTQGTYWMEWAATGTGASGPWIPPITITGQPVTGNALQFFLGAYSNANSGGNAQGFPFILNGAAITGPTIISQPNPQTICERGAVQFSVVATGTGNLTYQWKKDGVDIPGAVNADYSIPSVALSDQAAYTCLVSDDNGSTLSDQAALTVLPAPLPTLIGATVVCQNSGEYEYQTEMGKTGYVWRVPTGGRIIYDMDKFLIKVIWDTPGNHVVLVSYVTAGGCLTEEVSLNVTVNPAPVPLIQGENVICLNGGSYIYSTEPGMTNYQWDIKGQGRILKGQGTKEIEVEWTGWGEHQVKCRYAEPLGCMNTVPSILHVVVSGIPPQAGQIVGPNILCGTGEVYKFSVDPIPGAYSYVWSVPSGATITSGRGTNDLMVRFTGTVVGMITVYAYNSCGTGLPSPDYLIQVFSPPGKVSDIFGPSSLCENNRTATYTAAAVENSEGYLWSFPPGTEIIGENNKISISVVFPEEISEGSVEVWAYNQCGLNNEATSMNFAINPIPPDPFIILNQYTLLSDSPIGNQWYFDGDPIEGATHQSFDAIESGSYFCIVTINGCSSKKSNTLQVIGSGIDLIDQLFVEVYPNPNPGSFTVGLNQSGFSTELNIFNVLGEKIFHRTLPPGSDRIDINLGEPPSGWYFLSIIQGNNVVTKKILVH